MDYVGFCRSNYFKVKDVRAFELFCTEMKLSTITNGVERVKTPGAPVKYGFVSNHESGMPNMLQTEGQDIDIDFPEELAKHLAENEVAIIMEVGHEHVKYLGGFAIAVNSKGQKVELGLNDIYKMAKQLGTNITYCEN